MARSGLISAIERLQIRVADLFESGNVVFLGLVALSAPLVGYPLKLVFSVFHFHKAVMHRRSPQSESPATCYGGGASSVP